MGQQRPRPRKERFLFKEYSDETVRFDITDMNNTKLLGNVLGTAILKSFKDNIPVKGMYTFGRIGMGKTVLSTETIKSFENTEDLLIDIKHRVIYRYYDTYPKCYHLDYYNYLRLDFPYKDRIILDSDSMIIAEWSEYVPKYPINYFEDNRIEIELFHCKDKKDIVTQRKTDILNFSTITEEGTMRFASCIGYGNGIDLIKKLKMEQSIQALIVDPNEL